MNEVTNDFVNITTVRSITINNFGPLIAYLLPGFVVLWALQSYSATVAHWLAISEHTSATVGGFLYVTLASLAAGLVVSAIRWAMIDTLLHRTGIHQPDWDFAQLPQRVEAFLALVENTYRYYQFYANMLIAVVISFGAHLARRGWWPLQWSDLGVAVICLILYVAARDTLKKYYARSTDVLRGR